MINVLEKKCPNTKDLSEATIATVGGAVFAERP
jgi:phage FluMu protein Com